MDRYDDFQQYCAAKHRIYQHCENAIINLDEGLSWEGALDQGVSKIGFTLNKPMKNTFGILREHLAFGDKALMPITEMKLQGQHHSQNALACLALGYAIGLPFDPMLDILKNFPGLSHRCEWVAEKKGVHWYNDSKATNVGAALAAIETLGKRPTGKMILILGGDAKNADLSSIKSAVIQYAAHVIVLGKDAPRFVELLAGSISLTLVNSLEEAVVKAAEIAEKNDIVLLSPACASLDMFKNYEHRGQVFVQAVEGLS
jgi:UDP-N-acetylmuramoylalanine--D-glutamate ligase